MVTGRPNKYNNAEELQSKIDEYFEYIQGDFNTIEEKGEINKVYERFPENPAITALAAYLGFESRQSLYDYEKNKDFSYTIKRARLQIETFYEQNLLSKGVTGAIFALKNFGWKDKQEVEHSGDMGITWKEEKTYIKDDTNI